MTGMPAVLGKTFHQSRLLSCRTHGLGACPLIALASVLPLAQADLDQLQQDLERLRQRQAAAGGNSAAAPAAARQQATPAAGSASEQQGGSPLAGVKDAVDKLLIADFFFILFALAWLGAALAERSALSSTNLLDAWLGLWQWVFQPAIGVLMLGALVSGAVGWAKDNLGQGQR
ncbi:hypothetical protein ABPG75_011034 [Micractinium tetrahymenae]